MKRLLVGVFVLLVTVAACAIVWWRTPAQRHEAREFGIVPYVSDCDADGDGIDDQTDILASARAYVASAPAYGSSYYDGGRPDDGRGVCTDVVDQALLGAGYDLRTLVDKDIRERPGAYGMKDANEADANIDFRRVRNLRVWFSRHAQSLTTDPAELGEWQGGDIVSWEDHIGIVSDVRNAQGVALVIHHYSPWQASFEEDALPARTWGPIVGHWRMT